MAGGPLRVGCRLAERHPLLVRLEADAVAERDGRHGAPAAVFPLVEHGGDAAVRRGRGRQRVGARGLGDRHVARELVQRGEEGDLRVLLPELGRLRLRGRAAPGAHLPEVHHLLLGVGGGWWVAWVFGVSAQLSYGGPSPNRFKHFPHPLSPPACSSGGTRRC